MPDVFVDTDVSPGGTGTELDPYASWNEAWEAEDANIDPGETWTFNFSGITEDNDPVTIDGWNAGTGDLSITFRPRSGASDGQYTSGLNWSTSHYRIADDQATAAATLTVGGDNETTDARTLIFTGLQIGYRNNATTKYIVAIVSGASGTIRFGTPSLEGNRLNHSSTSANPRGIRADGGITSAVTLDIIGNLFVYSGGASTYSALNINDSLVTTNFYNNTFHYSTTSGGEDTIDDVSGCTTTAKNNVVIAAAGTNCEFDIAGTITKDFNAHTNSADRGASGWAIANTDFTSGGTADGDNLTPVAAPATDWDESALTNADDSLVPTIDIRGNARNTAAGTTTAAGCFAKAGEGGAAPAVTRNHAVFFCL